MPNHVVKQGECLSEIADKYGFFWETLWNHPNNGALKKLRGNPNVVLAGDSVFIPSKRQKEEPCRTNMVHKFKLKGIPARLVFKLLDVDGTPRARLGYTISIDGKDETGKSSADGVISHIISPDAKKARLVVHAPDGDEEYNFNLGHLNPVSSGSGVIARLINLGFYHGEIADQMDESAKDALRRFQENAGLPVTGEADDATKQALMEHHGS